MSIENTIPKIIHYCWFGKKEKPEIVKNCIESWNNKLDGYEIKEWNEENFDINSNIFVKQAYKAGKFAFVSDYVRLFGFLFFTVALILLLLWIFSGGSLFSGKNFQSILNLLFLSIVTFLMLLLVSNKPEDDLEKENK